MTFSSKLFLSISFLLLYSNGSALVYFVYIWQIGYFNGSILLSFLSLFGVVLASIADDNGGIGKFYIRYCFYGNLVVATSPLYYIVISKEVIPKIITLFL